MRNHKQYITEILSKKMTQIWPKSAIIEYSQKMQKHHFFDSKELADSNERIVKKCKKPPFWAFWAKIANFGQFLATMGKTGIFQKALGTFFRAYKP